MPRTILAIAVGETKTASPNYITTDPPPSGVRPYIQGLITGLSNKNYTIGNTGSYVIDYRTCPGSQLDTFIASLPTPNAFFVCPQGWWRAPIKHTITIQVCQSLVSYRIIHTMTRAQIQTQMFVDFPQSEPANQPTFIITSCWHFQAGRQSMPSMTKTTNRRKVCLMR